jgi:hypothetical protein
VGVFYYTGCLYCGFEEGEIFGCVGEEGGLRRDLLGDGVDCGFGGAGRGVCEVGV